MRGEKSERSLPDNMPLPPSEPRKRSRVDVANRRLTIAPKPPAQIVARSEDDEPPSDDVRNSSSSSSVESETSDTSLTDFRNRQKAMGDPAASSSKA